MAPEVPRGFDGTSLLAQASIVTGAGTPLPLAEDAALIR
jgi:hypothetical protein